MPLYEYKCDKGHVFEAVQSMSEDPLSECEQCGAPARRVLHPPAVHFKGKGFYNTDYGTRKRAREKARSSASETSGSSGDSAAPSGDSGGKSSKSSESGTGSAKSSSD